MFLKTKRKLSFILAMIMLLTMIPVSAFAADELNKGEMNVPFKSPEYNYEKTGNDRMYIYYPVIYLLSPKTIEDFDTWSNGVDAGTWNPSDKLSDYIGNLHARPSGNISHVAEAKYVTSFTQDDKNKPYRDYDLEGINSIYTNVGQYGYLKIRMNGKGGVGQWSEIDVSFNLPIYIKALFTTLRVNITYNPAESDGLGQPENVIWRHTKDKKEKKGIAQWNKVADGSGNDPGRQEYVLNLRKVGVGYSIVSRRYRPLQHDQILYWDFSADIERSGPGDYFFYVAAIGNGDEVEPQGITAVSPTFKYTVPSQELRAATDLKWVQDGSGIYSRWLPSPNIDLRDEYKIILYKDGTEVTEVKNGIEQVKEFKAEVFSTKKNVEEKIEALYAYIEGEIQKDPTMNAEFQFTVQPISGRRLDILDGPLSKISNVLKIENGIPLIEGASGKENQSALKLTVKPNKINVGQEATLSTSGGSTKGPVIYDIISTGTTGDATINGNKIKATKPGIVRIQATKKGEKIKDKDYNDVKSNIVELVIEIAPVELESKQNGNGSIMVIPDKKVDELIALAPYQEHGAAVITPGKKGKSTSIAVPERALDKLSRSSKVKGVAILFPSGIKMRLDSSALDAVLKDARGDYIVFNAKEIKTSEKTLTTAQKAFLDKTKPPKIYDISITSEGKMLYTSESANKGTLYVTLPYSPKDINAVPEFYYLDAKGYSNGEYSAYDLDRAEVIAELDHLSIYYLTDGLGATGSASGKVKLTFATNGGSTIKAVEDDKDRTVTLDYYTTMRTGFTFDGWYSDPSFTNSISRVRLTNDTTVYAKWLPVHMSSGFTDVPYNAWYRNAIQSMLEYDVMGGVSGNRFAPNQATTRGMIVTMLYRLEGSPEVKKGTKFADVKSNAYYNNAVSWAAGNKIVQGYGGNQFGPNDSITREQMAAILRSYSAYKKYNTSASARISQFRDFGRVSGYAVQSVEWAVGEQLIGGKGNGLLDPRGKATRAEVASIFQRYLEKFL